MAPQERFYWLDALRFFAAFMVLVSHTRNDFFMAYGDLPFEQQTSFSFIFYLFGRLGHEAVVVFFVLSGFLVGGRGFERMKHGTFDIRSYVIDRFSRIYPPLLLSIFFFYLTCLVVPTESWSWALAMGNFFNLQEIVCDSLVSPYWSLSYEWWFYIVFGCIVYAIIARSQTKKLIGFLLLGFSSLVFLMGSMAVHYLLIWFIGAVAYIARPKRANRLLLFISVVSIFIFIGLYQISKDSRSMSFPIQITCPEIIEILLSLSVCLFIQQIILNAPTSKVGIWLERYLGNMGNFSYSLYLSHRIVMMWLFYFLFNKFKGDMSMFSFINWMFIIIICMVTCWLLSILSERQTPIIKSVIKSKLINE